MMKYYRSVLKKSIGNDGKGKDDEMALAGVNTGQSGSQRKNDRNNGGKEIQW